MRRKLVATAQRRLGRVPLDLDLRPLPPVARPPGPLALRVVGHRRHRRHHRPDGHHGRDVPDHAHPAILAQATATSSNLLPGGRFAGVGTGEALNEHILGDLLAAPPTCGWQC